MIGYANPYSGNTFFEFFVTLASRLWQWVYGGSMTLASDELQLLTLISIATTTALLGTFLVFRKATMLVNALSHTILVGIVLAYCFYGIWGHMESMYPSGGLFFVAALCTAGITVFMTEWLRRKVKVDYDAIIGAVFTFFFAIGIILVSLFTRNAHIGAELLMGNADALVVEDLKRNFYLAVGNIVLSYFLFRGYLAASFDNAFAKGIGIRTTVLSYVLMGQVSLVALGAFRAVGVMLVLSFFVVPPLMARFVTASLAKVMWWAILFSTICTIVGVALSRHVLSMYDCAISTSALISTVLFLGYVAMLVVKPLLRPVTKC